MRYKKLLLVVLSIVTIIVAIGIGSVYVSPYEIIKIIIQKITNNNDEISAISIGIIWNLRFPRVILAFLIGSMLSVSGTVMQSVLKNPLASSYTLGVSAGAALGVAVFVSLGIHIAFLGMFMLPLIGLISGIATVILAVTFASKMDKYLENNTIVLIGMVFSLFINALLTLISALSDDTLQRMIRWQMGSFALKDWSFVLASVPFAVVGITYIMRYSTEMDNLTFGEDAAYVVGIDVKKVKWILLSVSSALTGCAVAMVGIIGFVDLIAPHVIRRVFGSKHRVVIPMAALFGGIFMVAADCIARTIISPSELPIGAVTALIGAPFFAYIYFKKR